MKSTRNEAVIVAPHPAKQLNAREIDKSFRRDERNFKAAQASVTNQGPCRMTVKTLRKSLK